jgi:hypothetical protein
MRLERASAEVLLERSSARLERAASTGIRLERAAPTDVLLERASGGTWPVSFLTRFMYKCVPVSEVGHLLHADVKMQDYIDISEC